MTDGGPNLFLYMRHARSPSDSSSAIRSCSPLLFLNELFSTNSPLCHYPSVHFNRLQSQYLPDASSIDLQSASYIFSFGLSTTLFTLFANVGVSTVFFYILQPFSQKEISIKSDFVTHSQRNQIAIDHIVNRSAGQILRASTEIPPILLRFVPNKV